MGCTEYDDGWQLPRARRQAAVAPHPLNTKRCMEPKAMSRPTRPRNLSPSNTPQPAGQDLWIGQPQHREDGGEGCDQGTGGTQRCKKQRPKDERTCQAIDVEIYTIRARSQQSWPGWPGETVPDQRVRGRGQAKPKGKHLLRHYPMGFPSIFVRSDSSCTMAWRCSWENVAFNAVTDTARRGTCEPRVGTATPRLTTPRVDSSSSKA